MILAVNLSSMTAEGLYKQTLIMNGGEFMKERMRRLAVLFLTGTVVITSTPTSAMASALQNDSAAELSTEDQQQDEDTDEPAVENGETQEESETEENDLSAAPAAVSLEDEAQPAAAAEEEQEIVHYSMEVQDGLLKNNAQEGMDGTLENLSEKNVNTYNGVSTLKLDGNGYVKLPAGILTDNTMTVSVTVANTRAADQMLWALGKDSWNYTFFTPANGSKKMKLSVAQQEPYNSTGAWAKENNIIPDTGAFLDGSYQTYTIVYDGETTAMYLNGEKVGTGNNPFDLSTFVDADGSSGYIGKSVYSADGLFQGQIADFAIANYAMSEEEVKANAVTDFSDYIKADIHSAMLNGNAGADAISTKLAFPAKVDGVELSWGTPSNTDVIAADGTVKPPTDEDAVVEIPVSFVTNGETVNETFQVTVTAVNPSERLQEAADALELPYEEVYGNITLPTASTYDTTVTWETDHEEIVDVKEHKNEGYDPTPAGQVTRPAEDTEVTMTAIVSDGTLSVEKDFTFTVKAAPEEIKESDYTDYFFTYFAGEKYSNGEQVYFAASQDGLNWTDLNNNDPVLTSKLGEQGVRDPYILRSPEGDKFYMIATDLKIYGNNDWNRAQRAGSKSLMVWESTDLVNWSEQRMVEVARDDAGCTWAPEATYDEKTGEYIVYWASRVAEDGYGKQRVYYAKTRDFYTFTEPEVMIEKSNDVIDTTILKENGSYYRYSKDESKKCIKADKVDTLLHANPVDLNTPVLNNQGGVEGPTIFKLNEDDNSEWKYCLLVDNYGGIGYYPLVSNDLDGDFTKLTEGFRMPSRARHGTPMRITAEEYKNVVEAYGVPAKEEEESKEPVLEYNFESDAGNSIADTGKGDNSADDGTAYGNAKFAVDEETGSRVLQLDGSSNTYAAFPQGFMDGRNVMTISMDVKSQMSSGNFFTFTYGLNSNKYNFLKVSGKNVRYAITQDSYSKENEVKTADGAAAGKWQNVTLVVDGTKLDMYLDGVLVDSNPNAKVLTSDLGKNLSAYLGKSFYSGDGYFKGSFDNVKVYNRALTADEIHDEISEAAIVKVAAEGYTISNQSIDKNTKKIHLDISRNNSEKADLAKVPLDITVSKNAVLEQENKKELNLTKPAEIKVTVNGREEVWTVEAAWANNTVLPGEYADPDIDVLDGKFYIYPTTDGFSGWSGTQFHAFSSEDMINWVDEGVIVDVASNDTVAGTNENGVDIAGVPWAVGSAWAPTIEEKNGSYYFYFCAKESNGKSAIGVAVSDSPNGPFVAEETPLVTMELCSQNGVSMGQTIDPSIFTDPDTGKSYMLFGNGSAAIVELGEDMISLVPDTMQNLEGAKDFREAITVTKRDGVYHFTWSCDDTGSANYHVNYGTSDSLYGPITFQKTILSKDASESILGTGHHSILQIPGKDEYYIAYHRFATPLGQYDSGLGYHRETCIDKLEFDPETGLMKEVTPTQAGITEPVSLIVEGWEPDGDRWSYVNPDGSYVVNDWKLIDGKWYHFDKSGYMQTGWLQLGKTWYYLKADGAMATGWLQLGSTWYYLKSSGAMATGWLQLGSTWYYLKSSGAMATGWLLDGKTWYYLKSSGAMATGWLLDGKTWYYLKSNGAMVTGWVLDGKTWYYLKSNGAMATGWVKVSGKWYYLYNSGAMASNTWVGRYYVNASGVWTKTR
ncbi:family 43 glycosylhydrolase [Lactonifactor sp. BIOML-A3]|nr:family 43 glycosylhydrolase [Lactonifactor sp. BIOML-A3]